MLPSFLLLLHHIFSRCAHFLFVQYYRLIFCISTFPITLCERWLLHSTTINFKFAFTRSFDLLWFCALHSSLKQNHSSIHPLSLFIYSLVFYKFKFLPWLMFQHLFMFELWLDLGLNFIYQLLNYNTSIEL